jgi:hypothetical protein
MRIDGIWQDRLQFLHLNLYSRGGLAHRDDVPLVGQLEQVTSDESLEVLLTF